VCDAAAVHYALAAAGFAVFVTRACNRRRRHFPEAGTRLAGFTFRLEDEQ